MDQNDNDLQGSDGSGSLGGPDVRRRIPIKLISKQPLRKPPTRPPRSTSSRPFKPPPGDEENFVFKKEEKLDCGAKAGDVFGSQRRFPQQLFWDYKLNLIGEKDDIPVHFCDKCGLPIHIYGRMIPCKHVFCYECALNHEKKGDKMCPGLTMYNCTDPVQRIEQSLRGALYMCSIVPGCKRTYLSQRDLQAHVNHRHLRAAKSSGPGGGGGRPEPGGLHLPPGASSEVPERFRVPPPHLNPKNHGHLPAPLKHGGGGGHGDPYGQAPPPGPHDAPPPSSETFRISTVTTRQHSNLITVPIQDDSAPSSSSAPPPRAEPPSGPGPPQQGPPGSQQPPPPPPHHHPGVGEYPGQPGPGGGGGAPPHSHHMMAPPPPQQHYGPPPPPPPPISHPGMQHGPPPPQGQGPQQTGPHMVYGQQTGPPPGGPMSSALAPPNTPPPMGHIMGQMPPYMNHPPPPPGPPHPPQGPPQQQQQHGGPPNAGGPHQPPPHHYNPNSMQQFSEEGGQGTLSPPFSGQPPGGGLSPGMGWPAPRGPPQHPGPPRMQGPPPGPPQGQMPGPHHPDQSRYRPYYQ